jgi:hypothetical protein
MTHPLVDQLRFARSEFRRGLVGLSEEEARRRLLPMNCISWMVGHLAWQEQRYWLQRAQGITLIPELDILVGIGKPASTPPLGEMWHAWETITAAGDRYLDALTTDALLDYWTLDGQVLGGSVGTFMQRVIYHYWYHTGEALAVRQMLGTTGLPDFVGNIDDEAPFRAV